MSALVFRIGMSEVRNTCYLGMLLGHVRFGSKADMYAAISHVRFTLESGHVRCNSGCPLSANSGLVHRSKRAELFDHLVGDGNQRRRDSEAERLRSL